MISGSSLSPALILILLVGVSAAFGIFDCCNKHVDKMYKATQVGMFEDYHHQYSWGVCDIDAIVFTVNTTPCGVAKRKRLCADPEQKWVKNMISAIDKLSKKSKKQQQKKRQKLCKRKRKNYA